MHFNLTSESFDDQRRTVATALRLGGRHLDVGQLPGETHVVLANPEGNEFCVVAPGNSFLAPAGGTKVTWGGPPLMPQTGQVHFDLAVPPGDVERLLSLGATRTAAGLADPGGNEFHLI
ncbi:VOC family protein [Actinoplanes sp. CA-015351]|uniref:VOC family protein n=1 Tax=Actinoplanes sp. CA-015351 TaxID=3239897 RepID=UPI003D98B27A